MSVPPATPSNMSLATLITPVSPPMSLARTAMIGPPMTALKFSHAAESRATRPAYVSCSRAFAPCASAVCFSISESAAIAFS